MGNCDKCKGKDGKVYWFHKRTNMSFSGNEEVHTYSGNMTPVTLCISCIKKSLFISILLNLLCSGAAISIGLLIVNALKGSSGGKGDKMIGIFGFMLILGGVVYLLENIWLFLSFIKPSENTGDHVAGTWKTGKAKISSLNKEYKTRRQFQSLRGRQ